MIHRIVIGCAPLLLILAGCAGSGTPPTEAPLTATRAGIAATEPVAPTTTARPAPLPNGFGTQTPPNAVPIASTGTPPGSSSALGSDALPDCVDPVENPFSLPAELAVSFPLPASARLYRLESLQVNGHQQIQTTGLTALNLKASTQYLLSELPKAGFIITNTDNEATETEGLFSGNGWLGSYRVNSFASSKTATTLTIVITRL